MDETKGVEFPADQMGTEISDTGEFVDVKHEEFRANQTIKIEITDSIEDNIQFEADVPSMHRDNKLGKEKEFNQSEMTSIEVNHG